MWCLLNSESQTKTKPHSYLGKTFSGRAKEKNDVTVKQDKGRIIRMQSMHLWNRKFKKVVKKLIILMGSPKYVNGPGIVRGKKKS